MKNIIIRILYVLYNYYKKWGEDIAYFSAVSALLFMIFMNLLTFLLFFRYEGFLIPDKEIPIYIKYLVVSILLLISFFVVRHFIPENHVLALRNDNIDFRRDKIAVFIYIILSVLLLFVGSYLKGVEMGYYG